MNNEINNNENNQNPTNYEGSNIPNNNYINNINQVSNQTIGNFETTQIPDNDVNDIQKTVPELPQTNGKKSKKSLIIIIILCLIALVIIVLFVTNKNNMNGHNENNSDDSKETNKEEIKIKNGYLYTFTSITLYVGDKIPDNITTYTNYNDVVEASGYDMFIRHKIKNDVIVENSVGFVYNGNVYYLKGGDGGASYNENKTILDNAFGKDICKLSVGGEYQCTIREPYYLQPNIEDDLGIVGVRGKDRETNVLIRVCSVKAGQSGAAECRG